MRTYYAITALLLATFLSLSRYAGAQEYHLERVDSFYVENSGRMIAALSNGDVYFKSGEGNSTPYTESYYRININSKEDSSFSLQGLLFTTEYPDQDAFSIIQFYGENDGFGPTFHVFDDSQGIPYEFPYMQSDQWVDTVYTDKYIRGDLIGFNTLGYGQYAVCNYKNGVEQFSVEASFGGVGLYGQDLLMWNGNDQLVQYDFESGSEKQVLFEGEYYYFDWVFTNYISKEGRLIMFGLAEDDWRSDKRSFYSYDPTRGELEQIAYNGELTTDSEYVKSVFSEENLFVLLSDSVNYEHIVVEENGTMHDVGAFEIADGNPMISVAGYMYTQGKGYSADETVLIYGSDGASFYTLSPASEGHTIYKDETIRFVKHQEQVYIITENEGLFVIDHEAKTYKWIAALPSGDKRYVKSNGKELVLSTINSDVFGTRVDLFKLIEEENVVDIKCLLINNYEKESPIQDTVFYQNFGVTLQDGVRYYNAYKDTLHFTVSKGEEITSSLLYDSELYELNSDSTLSFVAHNDTIIYYEIQPREIKWDLEPTLTSVGGKSVRCFRSTKYAISIGNNSTLKGNVQVTLDLDKRTRYSVYNPYEKPDFVNDSILQWNIKDMMAGSSRVFYFYISIPSIGTINHTLYTTFEREGVAYDRDTVELEQTIRCSLDPNDKQVLPEGIGEKHLTQKDSELDYLLRFQNVGNDTAFQVVVYDTLDANLNANTFSFVAASHPVEIKQKGRAFTFAFADIDLPDSTTNLPGSNGFIRFKVSPNAGLPDSTIIENKAAIVFDQNEPVITNTVFNTLVTELPATLEEPSAPILQSVTPTTATLQWTYLDNRADSLEFQWATDSHFDTFNSAKADIDEGVFTIEGLLDSTLYYVRYVAFTGETFSDAGDTLVVMTKDTIYAPYGLYAEMKAYDQVTLYWEDLSDDETSFLLHQRTSTNARDTTWSIVKNATSHKIEGLQAGEEYIYKIKAVKGDQSSDYSNETYVITEVTGLSDQVNEIKVYPNPIAKGDQLIISYPEKAFDYQLYDMSGHLVLQNSGRGKAVLTTDQLQKGSYILRMQVSENAKNAVQLIIVK